MILKIPFLTLTFTEYYFAILTKGIGSGSSSLEKCITMASRHLPSVQWKNCQHLIIDEISMIDSVLFDKIEAIARAIRKNEKPFGGIQLIICGDFLQLPPIMKKNETKKFCFQVSFLLNLLLKSL